MQNLIEIMRIILMSITACLVIYVSYVYYRLDKEVYEDKRISKKLKKKNKNIV